MIAPPKETIEVAQVAQHRGGRPAVAAIAQRRRRLAAQRREEEIERVGRALHQRQLRPPHGRELSRLLKAPFLRRGAATPRRAPYSLTMSASITGDSRRTRAQNDQRPWRR